MNLNRQKIYRYLLHGIAEGRFMHNDRIPTEHELGDMFSSHRLDAHYAVKQLQQKGILRRIPKKGTFVQKIPTAFQMGELQSVATRRVCVLNMSDPNYQHIHWNQRLIKPLEDCLGEQQFEIQFENGSGLKSPEQCRAYLSDLIAQGVNALVLIPYWSWDQRDPISTCPELMFEFHNNVFVFDRGVHQWGHWPYNIVSINVFGEGVLVARHLAGKQIKHVVFCSRPGEDSPWKNERRQGLKYGLYRETEGQQSFLDYQYTTNKVNRDFFQKIKSLISQGSTALVTENDEVAVDVLEAAAKQGLKAGDDYSLIGFDDNARYQSYNLTTVSPCLERIGQTLAGMISQSVDSNVENADVICTRVNSELKVRATG